jgi:cytidine deaminase
MTQTMRVNRETAKHLIESNISMKTVTSKTNLKHIHVALVMKRGKILSVASNIVGSRKRGAGFDDRTLHAERAAIKKIGDVSKLYGATLVVIRVAKSNYELGNSEPCHSCRCHLEKCIKDYGLKTVYYST